jgi:hypothetical protein
LGFLLFWLLFAVSGLLAVLLPVEKYWRLVGWWSGANRWSKPLPEARERRGADLQRRLAGLFITLMGLGGIKVAVSRIVRHAAPQLPPEQPAPRPDVGPAWLSFTLGWAIFFGGLYILVNPDSLVSWSVKKLFVDRVVPESTMRHWRIAFRAMGTFMMVGSISLLRM